MAGRCVYRQNPAAFWDYHDWIFEQQPKITPETLRTEVLNWAKSKNLDTLQLGRCMDTKATEAEVNKSIAEARLLKLNSTPTLFVNGRLIPGSLAWSQLKSVIDWELEYAKKTGLVDEKCCEISLPTPLKR
jgi:protein-disulfide isomerase